MTYIFPINIIIIIELINVYFGEDMAWKMDFFCTLIHTCFFGLLFLISLLSIDCRSFLRHRFQTTMTDTVMGTKGVHVQSGPGLGAELTDEEKEIINSVIARAEKMETMEQERIG